LLLRGQASGPYVFAFFFVAFLCGTTLSLCGILLGEMSPKRYPKLSQWASMVFYAVLENFGYRLYTTFLRLLGILDHLRGVQGWGRMERQGLASKPRKAAA
jgi:hypothetical protein